ncbi:MAG: glycosyltransferase family 2 protein [Pseudanabaenaceae cyanobacterium]
MSYKVLRKKLSQVVAILKSEGLVRGSLLILQKIMNKLKRKSQAYKFIEYLNAEKMYMQEVKEQLDLSIAQLSRKVTFSVIMTVFNVDEEWLVRAIESVRQQIYPYWELCIADDGSTRPHIRQILNRYANLDSRIKVVFRETNGGISSASNSALSLAQGDYIALLDHDDELAPHALYENAKLIDQHPEADYIYSDEDFIDHKQKRFRPLFKPSWSPELFYCCMYTCHLSVFRTSLLQELGGFRSEYDGSQDYDVVLRVTDKTKHIFHIPKILYHCRTLTTSSASAPVKMYAYTAGLKAIQDKLDRQQLKATVDHDRVLGWGFYRVHYEITGNPLVSIIIPSAGKALQNKRLSALENCLQALYSKTNYRCWEIIIVDGCDIPKSILERLDKLLNYQLVSCTNKFNFSQRINLGVGKAKGEHLLLLNDDTEPINPEWLEELLQLSQLKEIGAVGAKLLFPNNRLQHVGIVIPNGEKLYAVHPYYKYPYLWWGYQNVCYLVRNCIAVTGACLMVKRQLFNAVGGFNEDLPFNCNDVDFCLKLHKLGYRSVFTPHARLYHYESNTRQQVIHGWELEYMQSHWAEYLKSLGGYDPYYNPNFSPYSANFEL